MAGEQERRVDLDKLPPGIRAAADKAVPGARWQKAEQESGKAGVHYELKGKAADGVRHVEVELAPDGRLLQTEREAPLSGVPEAVRNKLKAGWPDFKPDEVKSVSREGQAGAYEFEGPRPQGRELEVFISTDGTIVYVEEDTRAD